MNEWLFNILKDNTLVDNQTYRVDDGIMSNHRFTEPFCLNRRSLGQHYYPHNSENEIWQFLNTTNREIQNLFLDEENKALVLFNNRDYEHNSEDNFIDVSGIDCMNFTMNTGNIIGFIKKGAYSIKISSRFGDNFLKHIISDADGFLEIENYGGSKKEEGYEWLLIYLWKTKVKKAYRLGLPKKYISKKERTNKVRGNINAIDYFSSARQTGSYQCEYREHSYNNEATRLIAATFKKIDTHEFVRDLTLLKNAFYTATDGQKTTRRDLHSTKYFTNPYYKEYNEVIDLSKLILRDELSDFSEQSENSAFFFDVSMLFEYFVRKLLKRGGYLLESKFENRIDIATGVNHYRRKIEPDIVFSHNSNRFLFDVKYKSFDFKYGVNREDLFQIHTYLGQYGNNANIKACGFIYPISDLTWEKSGFKLNQTYLKDSINIMGNEIEFYILFIRVPNNNMEEFHSQFSSRTEEFINAINLITTV
jgi:5-methylcytosine-specific restriction enzyme subunit McrC